MEGKLKKEDKIVLYFDLKNSREIQEKEIYQKLLKETIQHINAKYNAYIYVPLGQIKGIDEVEVILHSKSQLIEIILEFISKMNRYPYRVVMVHDVIEVIGSTVNELDGTAFYYLNPMINYLKKNNFYFQCKTDDIQLKHALNASLNMLLDYWYGLTDIQFEIFKGIRSGKTQSQIAQETNTTQQYISNVFKQIRGKLYLWIENQLNEYLNVPK